LDVHCVNILSRYDPEELKLLFTQFWTAVHAEVCMYC
jgi:hypothetical protein